MDNVFNPSANIWETMKLNDFKDENTIYLYDEVDRDSISIVSRQLRKACENELKKNEAERKHIKLRMMDFVVVREQKFLCVDLRDIDMELNVE